MIRKLVAVAAAMSLAGCATAPEKIGATYVSPLQYSNYDCDQVRMEMVRVSQKVHEVAGVQKKEANKDAWATGVGLVVFWPALFFLAGGNDRKEELAGLKGNYDALSEVAIQKKCPVADEIKAARDAEDAKTKSKKKS